MTEDASSVPACVRLRALRRSRPGGHAEAPCRARASCRPGVGMLAVVPAVPAHSAAPADFCLLLDDIQDPGNVGSMLRSAAAAGVAQVLLSRHCAFAWSPKVLRAGQGAHFLVDIHEDVDLASWAAAYRSTGDVIAMVASRRDASLRREAHGTHRARRRQRRRGSRRRARRAGDTAGDDPDAGRDGVAQRRSGGGDLSVRMRAAARRPGLTPAQIREIPSRTWRPRCSRWSWRRTSVLRARSRSISSRRSSPSC